MLHYQQIETLTYERQATLLAEAEQRRLDKHGVAHRANPVRRWVAQCLIAWGQQLASGQATLALPLNTKPVVR